MMKLRLLSSSLLMPMIFCAITCVDAFGVDLSEKVRMSADSIAHEPEQEIMRAIGNVRIDWQGYSLFADEIDYSEENRTALAKGRVKLLKGDVELICDALKINIDTQKGEADNANLTSKDGSLRVKGKQFEKTGEDEYHLVRGSFTTCNSDPPSWEFSAGDLELTVEGFATGKNVVFSVAGIPVFYTPYILFPVKRERQSGFLFPQLSNSTKKGLSTSIPYYWAISPSSELIIALDIQTKRGVGLGLEGGYLGRGGSFGNYKLFSIYDTNINRERIGIGSMVKQEILPTVELNADLSFASDRTFYKDYGEAGGDYNRQSLNSSISLTKRWDSWYLAGEVRIMNGLEGPNNEQTLQRLPELNLIGTGSRLWTLPLYLGMEGRLTNFFRREGMSGERLILQPTLTWYADLPKGESLSVWGGYQGRMYQASEGDSAGAKADGLALAGAKGSLSFERIYEPSNGETNRLRHLLTPELIYSYIQEKDQERLPFFDYDDRVVGQSLMTWAISSSLTGRFSPASGVEYRELLLLRLSQGYQLGGGRRELLNSADEGNSLTDIRLEARTSPIKQLTIEADSRFSSYRAAITTAYVGVDLHDDIGNSFVLGYRTIEDKVDYIEGKASFNLVKPFVFNYTSRYSFDRNDFLESYYSLEYRHQCWSVTLSYRDRPDNRTIAVNFNLAGIGNVRAF